MLASVVSVAVLAALAIMLTRTPRERDATSHGAAAVALVLHLSPVLLLMVIYPLAAQRINVTVEGVPLVTLLLASSVTVPWLSQPACLPLYRAIGDLLPLNNPARLAVLEHRLVAAWPRIFLRTLPAVLLFAIPLQLALRWPAHALATYVDLAILHVVFVQSLVLTNVAQRRGLWALSWVAYAVALFLEPTMWFLPPLCGAAVQLWSLRAGVAAVLRRRRPHGTPALSFGMTWFDIVKGCLLGSVLWGDKLLLFVVTGGLFDVQVVYLAMLPVVIAYNYYFVRLAPAFDVRVLAVREALENDSFGVLRSASTSLVEQTAEGLVRTAVVGALLNAGVCAAIIANDPATGRLAAVVSIASWLFMSATLLAYKLDYVGRSGWGVGLSAAHLVLLIVAFTTLPVATAYVALIAGETALVAIAAAVAYAAWSSPSYTLFWRHATAW